MARTAGIGHQDFEQLITKGVFYVDKTMFIKEWWESKDIVTLITRPRRFGKTLTMSMLEKFFSCKYAGRGGLFEGLSLWEDEDYRKLQGTYPVISLSFANVKDAHYGGALRSVNQILENLYDQHSFLLEEGFLTENEKDYFRCVKRDMTDATAIWAIHKLSGMLFRHYGKRVLILLDEYDAPMQEAYLNGYWKEMANFVRNLFNTSFKTNPYLDRAVMTGITRVSRESVFSDLNNLNVVTTSSSEYADSFGFTEEEVFDALDEFGMSDRKAEVKRWYDGFTFGDKTDIYNPWSIINFLNKGKLGLYWANTSSNELIGKLIREGSRHLKESFEALLFSGSFITPIDEQIAYNLLDGDEAAIWSLLVASGYLKILKTETFEDMGYDTDALLCKLAITNHEVKLMFTGMIRGWFSAKQPDYNDFIKAMLLDDLKAMNLYMSRVAMETFSYFDTGKRPSQSEPERFYHGFVLGLMVNLSHRYVITSNRESGFGRYDVMLEPRDPKDDAIIIEFKVQDASGGEETLADTAAAALRQIDDKNYGAALCARGIQKERIRKYGFAFCGNRVLIAR